MDDVLALAETQAGAVSLQQAEMLALSPRALHRHLHGRWWRPAGHGVFVRRGSPPTIDQQVWVALLGFGPDRHLSHGPGTAWWGVPGFRVLPVEVVGVRRTTRSRPGGRIHLLDAVPPAWVTRYRNLPVCRPEVLMLQLCATVHPRRAERALDTAWSMGLVDARGLRRFLDDWGRPGRNGTTLLRRLVAARGADHRPVESNAERRVLHLLHAAGLGPYRTQVDSGGEDWIGRTDLRHVRLPLAVEVQSDRYHASLLDRRADGLRRARLQDAGIALVEVWDHEAFHEPDTVVERVRIAEHRLLRTHPPGFPA